jgi:protocatechuate 3,4-dioxygenase beta subunit
VTRENNIGISIKRRQLMIAGAVGAAAAAPAGLLAAQCGGGVVAAAENAFGADAAGQKLVLSGRVLGFGCQPLAGAGIEVWQPDATPVRAITDADGRFVLSTLAPARARGVSPHLSYQVTHPAHDLRVHDLYFTRESRRAVEGVAQLERDDAGVWRAAFGLTLA